MHQDSEKDTQYRNENKKLQQQVNDLIKQLNMFDSSKRMEIQRSTKDKASLDEEIQSLKNQLENVSNDRNKLELKVNEMTSDCQTMERIYRVLEQNNNKLKLEYDEKSFELKNALSQANSYQISNFELAIQVKQLEEQLARAGQSKETVDSAKAELLEKFNEYGNVIQKETETKIEQVKKHYYDKISSKKEKLAEFQRQKDEYIGRIDSMKSHYEETISTLKHDLKRVKKEWESKLYYQDLEYQKQLTESTSKHKMEINEIQNEMQTAYEDKINELESDSGVRIEKSQKEHQQLKTALEIMEKECIKIVKHEEIVHDEVMRIRSEKDEELKEITEGIESELYQKIDQQESELEQVRVENGELEQIIYTEKATTKELTSKLRDIEANLTELKNRSNQLIQENGSLKSQLDDDYKTKNLEQKIRELHSLNQENEQLRGK